MNNTVKEVLYWSGTMPDNPLETIGATMNLDDQLKATAASAFNNILL